MEAIKITTTQNVDLEYEVASVGDRILAALIDLALQAGYLIGVGLILSGVGGGQGWDRLAIVVLLFLPVFFYDLFFELIMAGQSPGKKHLKIKVIRLDGSPPGLADYLLRWMFRLLDVLLSSGGVAILTIVLNGKGQRLGDIAAGTTVVKLKTRVTMDDTIFAKLQEDYTTQFPQVAVLSDEDIATVKEVLNSEIDERHSRLGYMLPLQTQKALAAKMGITSDMHPRAFLRTVLKDYNHVKGRV